MRTIRKVLSVVNILLAVFVGYIITLYFTTGSPDGESWISVILLFFGIFGFILALIFLIPLAIFLNKLGFIDSKFYVITYGLFVLSLAVSLFIGFYNSF